MIVRSFLSWAQTASAAQRAEGAGALARAAREALTDPARLEKMAAAAREHVLAHHVLEKQMEYVVRTTLARAGR